MKPNSLSWRLCSVGVILLSLLTFTPVIIPAGKFTPQLGNIPYTLWVGILLYFGFLALTFIGTRVHPGRNNEEE